MGRKHGLYAKDEWTPPSFSGGVQPERDEYAPSIDMVWFIDLVEVLGEDKFNMLHSVVSAWTDGKITEGTLRFIPHVAFEVEVSDTTSKTVYSDFHNLVATKAAVKIEVIREIGDMNLERAKRIRESAVRFCGDADMFVLTPPMLEDILKIEKRFPASCLLTEQKTHGVRQVQKKLVSLGTELNLRGEVEFTPPECREVYSPRLDAAWLVSVPKAAADLMATISKRYSLKIARDLCHFTLFGFEYEKETGHKHIAGGVANLSRHSYIGFLITSSEKTPIAKRIVNKYSLAFGFNNVFVVSEDSILGAV
ncbi:MAG: hypothetical protein N0A00_02455 [Candidatus Bathyarchaeota archaeon]|nr:hypothetical protein [Candidatus Bathyarchaeota archaeon]